MSYLRFTPDEYQIICRQCHRLGLGGQHLPAFRRLLGRALAEAAPVLAGRLARLRRNQVQILYQHFHDRTAPPRTRHTFTGEELRALSEACAAPPSPVRFVRPFKAVLVGMFEESWPELAQKLARLSGHQFEQIYDQACRQHRGKA